jgi:hypothetical protein
MAVEIDVARRLFTVAGADGCAGVTSHGPGQLVSVLAFPDVGFAVTDFFGLIRRRRRPAAREAAPLSLRACA